MQLKMFKKLTKLLQREIIGSPLAKVVLEFSNAGQAKELESKFPDLFKTNRKGKVTARRVKSGKGDVPGVTLPEEDTVTSEGTVYTTVTLGGLDHEAAAKRECNDLMNDNTFTYRSAIFPNPVDYGVTAKVDSVHPVKLKERGLHPWGVELKLSVSGERAAEWVRKFKDRIRLRNAT